MLKQFMNTAVAVPEAVPSIADQRRAAAERRAELLKKRSEMVTANAEKIRGYIEKARALDKEFREFYSKTMLEEQAITFEIDQLTHELMAPVFGDLDKLNQDFDTARHYEADEYQKRFGHDRAEGISKIRADIARITANALAGAPLPAV